MVHAGPVTVNFPTGKLFFQASLIHVDESLCIETVKSYNSNKSQKIKNNLKYISLCRKIRETNMTICTHTHTHTQAHDSLQGSSCPYVFSQAHALNIVKEKQSLDKSS